MDLEGGRVPGLQLGIRKRRGVPEDVLKIFRSTELTEVFTMGDTLAQALASPAAPSQAGRVQAQGAQ